MDEAATRELARVVARIDVIANWLMQGRDGSDAEGERSMWEQMDQLKARKALLLKEASNG